MLGLTTESIEKNGIVELVGIHGQRVNKKKERHKLQQTLVKELNGHPADIGCEIATSYLNEQSSCCDCPFRKCLKEIHHSTKQLLLNNEIIIEIYRLSKQGMELSDICERYSDQSPHTIRNWLNCQKKIQKTINSLRWAIPYL